MYIKQTLSHTVCNPNAAALALPTQHSGMDNEPAYNLASLPSWLSLA